MTQIEVFRRDLKLCKLSVLIQEGQLLIKFEDLLDESSANLLEECLLDQNISFERIKSQCSQLQSQQLQIIVSQKLQQGVDEIYFQRNNRQHIYELLRYIQISGIKRYILCRELFFNELAIILPASFFHYHQFLQVNEFVKILYGENIYQNNKSILEQAMIIDQYEYCISILRREYFTLTINWKNVKQISTKIDQNQEFIDKQLQSIVVDYIKSPQLMQKILSNIKEGIRFIRLNTCVTNKLDKVFQNKHLKFVENLELISLNQEQYIFSASRLKGIQITQLQQCMIGLKRLVLEDIVADCMRVNKIEELIIINNSSDIFYIDLDSNCVLHTLIIQRTNALQISEVQFLSNLQKLVLYDVDILEKDLQAILDTTVNLRYIKMKDVHFINWQLTIKNQNLEYISLDSMEFEQEFSDIFQLDQYPQVKYFAFINCRMNINYTLSCFNKFNNVEDFCLIDNTLGENVKLDLSEMPHIKNLNISCKQCKIYINDNSQISSLDFLNTNVLNLDKILLTLSKNLNKFQSSQQIMVPLLLKSIEIQQFSKIQSLNLSYSKLEGKVDLTQLSLQSDNLTHLDLSNNIITHFTLVNDQSTIQQINLSYNQIVGIELNIKVIERLMLHNNLLTSIDKINSQKVGHLNLHKNQLTDVSNILNQIHQIDILDVSNNLIQFLQILSDCQLQLLNSSGNKIQSIQLKGYISQLDLSKNELETLNDDQENQIRIDNLIAKINKLSQLPTISYNTLKQLDISNNKISKIQTLPNITYSQLQNLNLSNNQILTCDSLFQSDNFPSLQTLSLSSNLIESIEYSSNQLSSLKNLNISKNAIDSCDSLFQYPCKLEKIDLSFNNLICLTRYQINPQNNIKELKLKKNTFTDSSLNKLNNLNNLEILDLSMNLFTINIQFSHSLPKLRYLSIALNNLQNEGVKNIFENIQTFFPALEEIDIMHTQGNKLPTIQNFKTNINSFLYQLIGETISYIYQDNSLFFDNLEENKQLYLKGVLFQS